ncbi:MAG: pitrilysin family protein [Planctomycetota bacterium]|nr:pitrilysin family protein [Planctomycetota bacterium]
MPQSFHHTTLANGLTIIAEANPDAASSAAGFFVKTGARDEVSKVMGVSHFLEHMMFKGTHDITADELNRAFDEIGARNNAYTSSEMTCFYAHTLPEHLPRGVDLLGRMMRPALRQADFDTEKGVILEEIAMYKDNPFWVLYEATIEKHYGTHPMSHRVLGTDQTITDLKRDEMQEYFDFRYSADNTVVALAGKLDFDAAVKQISSLCGHWTRTGAKRDGPAPRAIGGDLRLTSEKVTRGYMLYLCPGPSVSDERRYGAALLAQILGASDNSRLHWALVETGLAEEAQAAYDGHDGIGDYYVYASGDPARLDEIAAAIDKELVSLVDSLTEDDLERLRNKIATGAALGGERPGDQMQRLGRVWTSLGKRIPLEEEVDRINRVTLDEIRGVARDFPIRPVTKGRLLPA